MTINLKLFDIHGCLHHPFAQGTYQNEPHKEWLIQKNPILLQAIQREFKEKRYTETIFAYGTNAQDKDIDHGNHNKGGSITYAIPLLQKYFFEQTGKKVLFDPFLMADIYGKQKCFNDVVRPIEARNLAAGDSFKAMVENKPGAEHAKYIFDSTKVSLIYAFAHRYATLYSNEEIVIDFYDDSDSIIYGLESFYSTMPEFLPKNVTFKIHKYNGDELTLKNTIKGKGEIDSHYDWTVRLMASMFYFRGYSNYQQITTAEALKTYHEEDLYRTSGKRMEMGMWMAESELPKYKEVLTLRDKEISKLQSNPKLLAANFIEPDSSIVSALVGPTNVQHISSTPQLVAESKLEEAMHQITPPKTGHVDNVGTNEKDDKSIVILDLTSKKETNVVANDRQPDSDDTACKKLEEAILKQDTLPKNDEPGKGEKKEEDNSARVKDLKHKPVKIKRKQKVAPNVDKNSHTSRETHIINSVKHQLAEYIQTKRNPPSAKGKQYDFSKEFDKGYNRAMGYLTLLNDKAYTENYKLFVIVCLLEEKNGKKLKAKVREGLTPGDVCIINRNARNLFSEQHDNASNQANVIRAANANGQKCSYEGFYTRNFFTHYNTQMFTQEALDHIQNKYREQIREVPYSSPSFFKNKVQKRKEDQALNKLSSYLRNHKGSFALSKDEQDTLKSSPYSKKVSHMLWLCNEEGAALKAEQRSQLSNG